MTFRASFLKPTWLWNKYFRSKLHRHAVLWTWYRLPPHGLSQHVCFKWRLPELKQQVLLLALTPVGLGHRCPRMVQSSHRGVGGAGVPVRAAAEWLHPSAGRLPA